MNSTGPLPIVTFCSVLLAIFGTLIRVMARNWIAWDGTPIVVWSVRCSAA